MDIAANTALLLNTLKDTTLFVLAEIYTQMQDNPVKFYATLGLAIAGYIFLTYYKFRFSRKSLNKKFEILVYIFSPFLFIMFTYYSVQGHPDNPLYVVLNYLGFYWLASVLMRVPSRYLNIKLRFRYTPSLVLILLSLSIALYLDVALIYITVYQNELKIAFGFARGVSKVFLVLGIFIYLKGALPQSLNALKETYPNLEFFTGIARLFLIAYFIMSLMWIFNLFTLDFRAVMAVALLGMLLTVISYLLHKIKGIIEYFYSPELYSDLEWGLIRKHLSRFIILAFVYIYYLLAYNALDMQDIIKHLKSAYLFQTKLFSLSVLGLVSAFFIFMLLKSLLYLFTKYLRVFFADRELADDTDSLEIIVYNLGLLLVIMATMLQLGITWQVVVPMAGALGIGIGFGLQTVINNYICGFILLFSKKIRIGDFVELPGSAGSVVGVQSSSVFGKVASIDMFATTVQTYDNIEIMVPNSVFISDTIINYTRSDKYIRVRVPVGIAYSSDIDLAQKLMYEAIDECEHVVKYKGRDVWFMEYGDSSLNFMVLFWLNMSEGFQVTSVKNLFLTSLWHKFKEHDIEIPFPQQDVWFRNELNIADKDKKGEDK